MMMMMMMIVDFLFETNDIVFGLFIVADTWDCFCSVIY